jgi:hypothetical protein
VEASRHAGARARERAQKHGGEGWCALGVVLVLYRGRGSIGERRQWVVMASLKAFKPLMARSGWLRGV